MSQVHFKTPQVKSFFSQHDHFEYSQIAVKQDVQEEEEEALVSGDCWQVDGLRRELISYHKDKRMNLHEMNRSETTPIPKDELLDERETHMELQKSRKKVLHKDNWRSERKRFSEQSEEFWKGKTIYKIKEDYVIPENVIKSDLDRAKPFRGNIDDLFHPESASSAPSGVQKNPSYDPKSKLPLILAHMMLLDSINLNSILPRMEKSSQKQNQLSPKKS